MRGSCGARDEVARAITHQVFSRGREESLFSSHKRGRAFPILCFLPPSIRMKATWAIRISFYLGITLSFPAGATNWPAWRGPQGTGISSEQSLPLKWSTNENVRWRVPLPEPGNSSPIVWGDRVFVTQAVQQEKRRTVMCFNRGTGKLLWQSGITYAEPEPTQEDNR